MSTLSLPKGSSLALPLFYCPIPLSLIIPAHTRYPGGGGLVIPIRHTPPLLLNIPYLTTSFSSFRSPLSLSSHSTPRLLRLPLLQRNLPISRPFAGARPAGMSSFAYRCPNAHH